MKLPTPEAEVETLFGGWTNAWPLLADWWLSLICFCWMNPRIISTWRAFCGSKTSLKSAPFATLLVSHDRYSVENSVSVLELSRLYPEGLLTVEGSYSQFLERKTFLSAQEQLQETLANRARWEWSGCGGERKRDSQVAGPN
jgi:ATP-binding cassette subfamily F protein uup